MFAETRRAAGRWRPAEYILSFAFTIHFPDHGLPTVTDSSPTSPAARFLVIVVNEPGSVIDPGWLESLRAQCPCPIRIAGWPPTSTSPLEALAEAKGPWWQWLDGVPPELTARGVLLLAAGLHLPDCFARRVAHLLSADGCPAPIALPGNHEPGLDPAAGLVDASFDRIDAVVNACAELQWAPVRHQPRRLAIVPPGQVGEACRLARSGQCWVYDGIRVHDPVVTDSRPPDSPDRRAALGHLRAVFTRLIGDRQVPELPLFGFDARETVLHVSHSWGGGVARWIDDLIAADSGRNHLVLSALGHKDGRVHGQRLILHAAGPGRGEIHRWPVSPAIDCTASIHAGYRTVLEGVIQRYGVGRVIVSSLIGHGLDALGTGLPTAQVLHDYYPAWPVLDEDPLAWTDADGRIELESAIEAGSERFLFERREPAFWETLAGEWLAQVVEHDVRLIAPTRQVLERWRRLVDAPLDNARVIAHGFSGWPRAPEVRPRALPDGRLNLVHVGRLSHGKGLNLLEQALPELRRYARITLLGCGRDGMRLFGQTDVDIILDYRHADLPRHLAGIGPQAVLLLSTVAETWNYVLSETRALGLVPVATRTGSFIERITDGHDGVLFEPTVAALVDAVRSLAATPECLEVLRRALPAEPTLDESRQRLDRAVGIESGRPAPPGPAEAADLGRAQAEADLGESRIESAGLRRQIEDLRSDLARRTDWARRQERLAGERTRWAKKLEQEQEQQRERFQQQLDEREHELQEARAHITQLDAELQATHEHAGRLDRELKASRDHARRLDEELALIHASRSWRLTRPLRFSNRLLANALANGWLKPARWPRLASRLLHTLQVYGLRQTLAMAAQPQARGVSEPGVPGTAEPPDPAPAPVRTTRSKAPLASIVVPVFNKLAYTAACLNSIVEHSEADRIEIIVVDDCSTDETADYLADCEGLRVIRNKTNSGFIRSVNAGAAAARGEFLVLLNNDTTVSAGWLEALVETFDLFPGTGAVGARLIYPDGTLQEAGGIIFSDASGWNYGRGDRADRPRYNFASEADYVSGACLAIRRQTFCDMGGFDDLYAPAYYEDTDLCFRLRERGLAVIYQPACTIVHHEGISSGTDETSGIKRYQNVNRRKFAERWAERLAHQPPPVPGLGALAEVEQARHFRSRGEVLIIDATTPEPDKDSGSMRMLAMLEIFRDLGYRVRFVPENLARIKGYTRGLQKRGIEALYHPELESVRDWLKANGARLDLVLVSRHYVLAPLMPALRQYCTQARIVFDTVDLHFLREQRKAELTGDKAAARMARRTRQAELELIDRADTTLVVSPIERQLLAGIRPGADIRVLSNIHHVHGRTRDWAERRDLMFVGGFQHPPNVDAVEWLIGEIMPKIRDQLPEVRLHVIGSRMPEHLRRRRSEGVVLHGYVEDIHPYLESCRLSLAPLRYGAGVKGKVNQAMAWGLPVIATPCAAEGMFLADGKDVLLGDDTDSFAAAVVRAYSDRALWEGLSDGGLANVERHFSRRAARRVIEGLVEPAGA